MFHCATISNSATPPAAVTSIEPDGTSCRPRSNAAAEAAVRADQPAIVAASDARLVGEPCEDTGGAHATRISVRLRAGAVAAGLVGSTMPGAARSGFSMLARNMANALESPAACKPVASPSASRNSSAV